MTHLFKTRRGSRIATHPMSGSVRRPAAPTLPVPVIPGAPMSTITLHDVCPAPVRAPGRRPIALAIAIVAAAVVLGVLLLLVAGHLVGAVLSSAAMAGAFGVPVPLGHTCGWCDQPATHMVETRQGWAIDRRFSCLEHWRDAVESVLDSTRARPRRPWWLRWLP